MFGLDIYIIILIVELIILMLIIKSMLKMILNTEINTKNMLDKLLGNGPKTLEEITKAGITPEEYNEEVKYFNSYFGTNYKLYKENKKKEK